MTFIEVLLLIEQRGEKMVSDKIHSIQTDKHLYERGTDGVWVEKQLPPPPVETIQLDYEVPKAETIKGKKKKK